MKKILVALVGLLSFIYLLNPGLGIFELLPDNIPFIGNLDEVTFTTVLFAALRYFGWDPTNMFMRGAKSQPAAPPGR